MSPKSIPFYIILALLAALPLAYWIGTLSGATRQREATELATLVSSAKNDVATSSAIAKLNQQYDPIYITVDKYHEAPPCTVPAVIRDTIGKLPAPARAAH